MHLFGGGFETTSVENGDVVLHLVHGGTGPPLLLLHGYPETHAMWHRVAPQLADRYHVICPDLRGYGDSDKPAGTPDHATYSKRAMASDMIAVMDHFGYQQFAVAGHDRGARVTHRLILDNPARVQKACVMDIVPTLYTYQNVDSHFATAYYHWFFLSQPDGLPERLIGADPAYYLQEKLRRWSAPGARFNEDAVAEYIRCFSQPEAIHASCEDYRAAATIDLVHDENDQGKNRVACPLLVLWGKQGIINRIYQVPDVWQHFADRIECQSLDCGHFLPEEAPDAVVAALRSFLN